MAFQFDCPEQGVGVVQAFRRAESPCEAIRVKLRGLDPRAVYALTNLNVADNMEMTGRDLLENGLPMVLKNRPGAMVISYRKKP